MSTRSANETLHATTVCISAKAVLIVGGSGSGKSSLALQLIALGADLVADDRTVVQRAGDGIVAGTPPTLSGLIEARGIGILNARPAGPTRVHLVVNLDVMEVDRLPPARLHRILGIDLPCLHKVDSPAWPAGILQYLRGGVADI